MYTVFIPKREIVFSYKTQSMWSPYRYEERKLHTSKDIFFCDKNDFTAEGKSIEEIHRMITEGFAFFPINEGTRASEIKDYIKMGFHVAFLRAGDYRKFKKEYRDFI